MQSFPVFSAHSESDGDVGTAGPGGETFTALSRQFGRNYPTQMFCQKWFVKVSEPKWCQDEGRYKYEINIAMNPSAQNDDNRSSMASSMTESSGSYSHLAFPSTSSRRSLQDFLWLEQALRTEYHGALLAPILSVLLHDGSKAENLAPAEEESLASGSHATDATSEGITAAPLLGDNSDGIITHSRQFIEEKLEHNETVDESLLANWLSDTINGIRGNGEVILYSPMDVAASEAMETFLYRHSAGSHIFGGSAQPDKWASTLGSPFNLLSVKNGCQNKSLLENLVENPFECFGMDTMCGGDNKKKTKEIFRMKPQLDRMKSSSGNTGVPGTANYNSFYYQPETKANVSSLQSSQGFVIHSELLEAERNLILSFLKSSSLAMSKVQSLTIDETFVGQCWKRFAISLSNLFSIEKDLEQAHIGDQIKSNKKNQPFRKLRKSVVDNALRILGYSKSHRSNPGLRKLQTMLNAYVADLNSATLAFSEYSQAMHQLDEEQSIEPIKNDEWFSPLEQLKAVTWGVAKHISGGGSVIASESDPTAHDELSKMGSISTAQTDAYQARFFANEKILKFSLTILCKATPLRNARMAWWYLKTEAKQALKVHTAATRLRQKLSIDADAAISMKERRYGADEER